MIYDYGVQVAHKYINLDEKPFAQSEVDYQITAPDLNTRCQVCRFFRQGFEHDPCLLVENRPLPIVSGGTCNQFLPLREVMLQQPQEDVLVFSIGDDEDSEEEIEISSARGFRMFGPDEMRWIAWYSNNFEDKDGELFTTESLDFFNAMTSQGIFPMPELWSCHQAYLKHGVAERTFRLGHFQLAVGKFDDPSENVLVDRFRNYYRENRVTMSHGFYYSPALVKNGAYLRHQTFEVSTLKPGREANPFFTELVVEA